MAKRKLDTVMNLDVRKRCGVTSSFIERHGLMMRTNFTVRQRMEVVKRMGHSYSWSRIDPSTLQLHETTLESTTAYDRSTMWNYDNISGMLRRLTSMKRQLERMSPEHIHASSIAIDEYHCVTKNVKRLAYNRCGVKLVNLNCCFDNIIGKTITQQDCRFADLCCAPGGFTHVLLQLFPRQKFKAYLTSKEGSDSFLKIDESALFASPGGEDKIAAIVKGDITEAKFRDEFEEVVGKGSLNFVLADGGINFKNIEDYQEFYTRPLIMSQIEMGLRLLKPGGFMIVKFFDMLYDFTVSLMYLMRALFDEVVICKPVSSKTANAERYVLFRDYKPNVKISNYLSEMESLQRKLFDAGNTTIIGRLLPFDDNLKTFAKSMENMNKTLGNEQFAALQKLTGRIVFNMKHTDIKKAFDNWHLWVNRIQK